MAGAIGVIVRVEQDGPWFARLLTSLDAQTLGYDAFEVVLAVAARDTAIARRAAEVSRRRPNVRTVPAEAGAPVEVDARWRIDLGPSVHTQEPSFTPDALERIAAFGDAGDYGVVLAGTVDRSLGLASDLFAGAAGTAPAPSELSTWALPRGVAAHRTDASAGSEHSVGVLRGGPVLQVATLDVTTASGAVRVDEATAHWSGGRLQVTAAGTAAGVPADAEVRFALVERSTGITHWLPSTSAGPVTDRFAGATEVDVRAAAGGAPLPEGMWQVRVGVHGTGTAWSRRLPVPLPARGQRPGPALVDGVFVVPASGKPALILDVGARTTSPVGSVAVSDASITDTARGTLLRLRVPDLAVTGPARTPGGVLLGKFRLPAVLVGEAGDVAIEAYVSGLAGSSPLATQFGRGKPAPTGLVLAISPTGTVSVTPRRTAGAAKKTASTTRPAQRLVPSTAPLQQRVPPALRPVAAALARNKVARRVYRSLSGR